MRLIYLNYFIITALTKQHNVFLRYSETDRLQFESVFKESAVLFNKHVLNRSQDNFTYSVCSLGTKNLCACLTSILTCFQCIYPKITEWRSKEIIEYVEINFTSFDIDFSLRLKRIEVVPVINKQLKVQIVGNENVLKKHYDNIPLYKGIIINRPGSAHGIYKAGLFDGIIEDKHNSLYIEPLYHSYPEYTNLSQQLIIYRDVDMNKTALSSLHRDGRKTPFVTKKTYSSSHSVSNLMHTTNNKTRRNYRYVSKTTSASCEVHLVADPSFYQTAGNNTVEITLAEMIFHLSKADEIFRSTDFDGNGLPDNIGFVIVNITIYTSEFAKDYRLSTLQNDASSVLDLFSTYNFDNVCLAYLFTSRTFIGGTVGLSWTAGSTPHSAPGGICQKLYSVDANTDFSAGQHSFNTGLVTNMNFGRMLNRDVVSLTLTHEFGHSFGSMHDDPNDPVCSPTDFSGGKYIMYSYASNADEPNNYLFSKCSIPYMEPVIKHKGTCMKISTGAVCGNMIIEDPEECDCGLVSECDAVDPCCTAALFIGDKNGCTIRRSSNFTCSSKFSPCCDQSCNLFAANITICLAASECLEASLCDGESGKCPRPLPKHDGTLCRGGAGICHEGSCSQSICSKHGLIECQCTLPQYMCHLCCRCPGKGYSPCVPAFILNITDEDTTTVFRLPGEICNNNQGYCDEQNFCRTADQEAFRNFMRAGFFKNHAAALTASNSTNWITFNWYFILFGIYAFLIVLTLLWICWTHRRPICKSAIHKQRPIENLWKEAEAELEALKEQTNHLNCMHDLLVAQMESPDIEDVSVLICRLATFFPTSPRQILIDVVSESNSEEQAVKRIIDLEYPVRELADTETLSGKIPSRMPRKRHKRRR